MKATVESGSLADGVAYAVAAVDAKSPSFNNLRLEVANGQLKITGASVTTALTVVIETRDPEPGVTAVDHKRFASLVSNLPAKTKVRLDLDDAHFRLRCKGSSYKFASLNPDSIMEPRRPTTEGASIRTKSLAEAMTIVIPAMADEGRADLHGLWLEAGHVCATDAHQILVAVPKEARVPDVFLPAGAALTFHRFLSRTEEAKLVVEGSKMFAWTDTHGFMGMLGESKTSPLKILQAQKGLDGKGMKLDTGLVVQALDRLLAFRDQPQVMFEVVNDALELRVQDPLAGSAREVIPLKHPVALRKTLHGKHVRDFLRRFPSARILTNDRVAGIRIPGADYAPLGVFSVFEDA